MKKSEEKRVHSQVFTPNAAPGGTLQKPKDGQYRPKTCRCRPYRR